MTYYITRKEAQRIAFDNPHLTLKEVFELCLQGIQMNTYWVKLEMLQDVQDPSRGKKTKEYFINTLACNLEKEISYIKNLHYGEVTTVDIRLLQASNSMVSSTAQ